MDYKLLAKQVEALDDEGSNVVGFLANVSALLFEQMSDVSWVGFYLWDAKSNTLQLGPFQGKVACMRIPWGSGVCGTAAQRDKVQVVPDVHAFPGHIACDSASRSELVLPLHDGEGRVNGVLDLDSTSPARFTKDDAEGLALTCSVLERIGIMG